MNYDNTSIIGTSRESREKVHCSDLNYAMLWWAAMFAVTCCTGGCLCVIDAADVRPEGEIPDNPPASVQEDVESDTTHNPLEGTVL